MNLYKIEREDHVGFEEYDAWIVAAETEQDARSFITPGEEGPEIWETAPCLLIGLAAAEVQAGTILGSFNAA